MPTRSELLIFIDDGYLADALLTAGFSNVKSDYSYWAGTDNAFNINEAWTVSMSNGSVFSDNTGHLNYAWPVHDGK